MQTKAVSDRNVLNQSSTQGSAWSAAVPPAAESSRTSSPMLLAGASAFGALGLVGGGWHFAGWLGLSVALTSIVVFLIACLVAVATELARTRREWDRVIGAARHASDLDVASFRLSPGWQRTLDQFLELHRSLVQQLRDRQGATQKLELAQRVAQASQRRAEAVVNSLADAVVVTNSFGELVHANPEAERLFRFRAEQASGKPIREVITHAPLLEWMQQSVQSGLRARRHVAELSIPFNGRSHWFKVTTTGLLDGGPEPLGTVTMLRDTTPEKAAQARSAEFVSAVSHEIKTPLASVKAYAEMLADGDADGDAQTQQKFLGIIEAQTDRMTRMLDSMLDMARIESGVVRPDKKLASLNDLIDAGVKLMQPAATEKTIALESRLSSLYLGVEVDTDMMSRVIVNLLSNAIKYTEPGGKVTIRSQMLHDQAMFEVEDSGRGIPAEAMDRLFEKFYRVKENAGMAPGTGLGLYMVRHIVQELHGGKVEIESEVGKGSIFRVKLSMKHQGNGRG